MGQLNQLERTKQSTILSLLNQVEEGFYKAE